MQVFKMPPRKYYFHLFALIYHLIIIFRQNLRKLFFFFRKHTQINCIVISLLMPWSINNDWHGNGKALVQ